jgi:pyruvate-ferredoxin/flavodoxin oxidoreductase
MMLAGKGDLLPVSAFPADGTWPTGTAKWEKRSIALTSRVGPSICIQCNKCALCARTRRSARRCTTGPRRAAPPRASSRCVEDKDPSFAGRATRGAGGARRLHRLRPVRRGLSGQGQGQPAAQGARHEPRSRSKNRRRAPSWDFFLALPRPDRARVTLDVKGSQLLQPLFEFSGACAGCGETPYLKLLTQLFGDRTMIANATGCSSIYGGNLPTTPYTTERERGAARRGPTRCSRTTPSSASASASPSTRRLATPWPSRKGSPASSATSSWRRCSSADMTRSGDRRAA